MAASIMNVRSMKSSPVADSNENRPTREGPPWSPEHAQVLLCIMETSMCVCVCVSLRVCKRRSTPLVAAAGPSNI